MEISQEFQCFAQPESPPPPAPSQSQRRCSTFFLPSFLPTTPRSAPGVALLISHFTGWLSRMAPGLHQLSFLRENNPLPWFSICVLPPAPQEPAELHHVPTLFPKDSSRNSSWFRVDFALSWNLQTESSPLSSPSVFRTGRGHISHQHSEFNVPTSSLGVFSLVLLLRASCHTPKTGGKRARRILYSPITKIPGFPKKTEYPVDVGSKQKPKILFKKKLSENKPQKKKPEKETFSSAEVTQQIKGAA